MVYLQNQPDDFGFNFNTKKMNLRNGQRPRVGIVGTGCFAASLTNRLLASGYDVIIGSRQPSQRNLLVDKCFCNFHITTISECIEQSDIIILAIHAENYRDTLLSYSSAISNKILIDVSNKQTKSKEQSFAEYLAAIFPSARVIKAFNTIPACEMKRNNSRDISRVFVAGDDIAAKHSVSTLVTNMGFYPVDRGPLQSARFIEDFNLRMFPEWRGPALVTVALFNIWLVYVILMIFAEKRTESWNQLFLKVVNKPICLTAITLMAVSQLPRPVGAVIRCLSSGNRKSPSWFKRWVSARTRLGVISWILMAMHVIISVLLTNKTYFPTLYEPLSGRSLCNHSNIDQFGLVSDWMNWKGEAGILLGLVAMAFVCVQSASAIPGIQKNMSWRERRFTQSTVSYIAIFLALCHVVMTAIADWTSNVVWPFYHSTSFLCIILPILAILCVVVAACPCVKNALRKRTNGVNFYDVGNSCECPTDNKDNVKLPVSREITIFQERQRLADRVGYSALIEEE